MSEAALKAAYFGRRQLELDIKIPVETEILFKCEKDWLWSG